MTDTQLQEFFLANSDYFINNNIALYGAKSFGWWIFKGIVWIAGQCQQLYDISFGLVDFTSWGAINEYVSKFKPLFIALMAVSLFALGIMLILHHEKKPKILINLCIACLCVTSSTLVFTEFNNIVKDLKTGIESIEVKGDQFNGVYDIVSSNLVDLAYMDQKVGMKNIDFSNKKQTIYHPKITKDNFWMVDYAEVMNSKADYDFNKEGDAETILKKRLMVLSTKSGLDTYKIREVYNGFGWNSSGDADLANEFYYRYKMNFFQSMLELIAIIILYIAMSYKCVRIIFELVVSRLLAYLYSSELSGGEKVGKILVFIRDSYILLLITTLCIRFFYLFSAYIQQKTDSTFVQGVLILFVAFAVIDGPNLVEKLIGMDAGLKSSTARMMAAYAGVKGAARAATAPGRMAGSILMQEHRAKRWAEAAQQRGQQSAAGTGTDAGGGPSGAGPSAGPDPNGNGGSGSGSRADPKQDPDTQRRPPEGNGPEDAGQADPQDGTFPEDGAEQNDSSMDQSHDFDSGMQSGSGFLHESDGTGGSADSENGSDPHYSFMDEDVKEGAGRPETEPKKSTYLGDLMRADPKKEEKGDDDQ